MSATEWFQARLRSGEKSGNWVPVAPEGATRGAPKAAAKPRKAAAKKGGVAKYTDGAGRTWSGVGKRPNWFKDAIAAGKQAEDLLIAR